VAKLLGKALYNLTPEEKVILEWAEDPVRFVRECLGVDPEPWQQEALYGVRDFNRIAIRSGHGVGKTAFLAWVILWWMLTRYPCKIPCTANTATQLEDVLWTEVDKWHRKMPEGLKQLIVIKNDRVELRDDPKQSFAVARTARKENPEAFQGYHQENLLFIADEASGIDDIIFEVGKGSMSTPGAKTILTGNPTRTTGYFFNAFHQMRHFWKTLVVPCSQSKQVTEAYIQECLEEYGADSNMFRVRVLGEFPIEGDDILIPLSLVESAVDRDVEPITGAERTWGLDVARFGDDRSALCKRWGNIIPEPVVWWSGKDAMQVTGLVMNEWNNTPANEKPDTIYVDAIGYGAGVADRLAELGLPISAVNVAESPAIGDKFMRLRDELWWNAREWFKRLDVRIANDPKLIGELTLPTYAYTSGGKIKVEGKDEMKKRTAKSTNSLGKSPDLADAFCLTFGPGSLITKKQKPIKYPSLGLA
jgi:phage terminase large subunit